MRVSRDQYFNGKLTMWFLPKQLIKLAQQFASVALGSSDSLAEKFTVDEKLLHRQSRLRRSNDSAVCFG